MKHVLMPLIIQDNQLTEHINTPYFRIQSNICLSHFYCYQCTKSLHYGVYCAFFNLLSLLICAYLFTKINIKIIIGINILKLCTSVLIGLTQIALQYIASRSLVQLVLHNLYCRTCTVPLVLHHL